MFKHYFEQIENVAIWPIISLSIFFLFFIVLVIWVIRVDKKYINEMKQLPFKEKADKYSYSSNGKHDQ